MFVLIEDVNKKQYAIKLSDIRRVCANNKETTLYFTNPKNGPMRVPGTVQEFYQEHLATRSAFLMIKNLYDAHYIIKKSDIRRVYKVGSVVAKTIISFVSHKNEPIYVPESVEDFYNVYLEDK